MISISIPAPELELPTADHRTLCRSVSNAVEEYVQMRNHSPIAQSRINKVGYSHVADYFSGISEKIVKDCINLIMDEDSREYSAVLVNAMLSKDSEAMLDNLNFMFDLHSSSQVKNDDWDISDETYELTKGFINGLTTYEEYGMTLPAALRDSSMEQRALILSLYEVSRFSEIGVVQGEHPVLLTTEEENYRLRITDGDIVEAVITHYEQTDRILDFIEERGWDGALLKEHLSSNSPLRDGTL